MSDKEVTVVVIDVGRSMGERHNSRDLNDLEWGMKYVDDMICDKILSGRKTDQVGLVGVRTNSNEPDDQPHVMMFEDIKQWQLADLNAMHDKLVPSETNDGDIMWGIVKAIDMIKLKTKKLKYKRSIIVVTNATGEMNFADSGEIIKALKADSIQLKILGIDFDIEGKPVYGGNQPEEEIENKTRNQQELWKLGAQLDDLFAMESYELILNALLTEPRIKSVRPVAGYKGPLTIGNSELFGSDRIVEIFVETYPCTRKSTPPSSRTYYFDAEGELKQASVVREYYIPSKNPSVVDTKQDLEVEDEENVEYINEEDRVKGYLYGREIVPVTEDVENVFKTSGDNVKGLDIIAFCNRDRVPRWYKMSSTDYVVAERFDQRSSRAMSSLCNALYEMNFCAFGRLVSKDQGPVRMVLLTPYFEENFEALILCDLPFDEDYRRFAFPSLTELLTKSGKLLPPDSKERILKLPNDQMNDAMEAYVDKLDLMMPGETDGDPDVEYAAPEELYHPLLHRIKQVIKNAAITNDVDSIPPIMDILVKYSRPPEELMKNAKPELDKLKDLLDIAEVPSAKEIRAMLKSKQAPVAEKEALSDLDIDALLANTSGKTKGDRLYSTTNGHGSSSTEKELPVKEEPEEEDNQVPWKDIDVPEHVREDNSIPDLKNMVGYSYSLNMTSLAQLACEEMGQIVKNLIEEGMAGADDRIVDNFNALKEICESYPGDLMAWFNLYYQEVQEIAPKRINKKIAKLFD